MEIVIVGLRDQCVRSSACRCDRNRVNCSSVKEAAKLWCPLVFCLFRVASQKFTHPWTRGKQGSLRMLRQSGTVISSCRPISSFLCRKSLNPVARCTPFKSQSRSLFAAYKYFSTPKPEVIDLSANTKDSADVKVRPESYLRPEGINGEADSFLNCL